MIGWLAVGGALLFAVVVLGFCAYEVFWRVRRLQRDAATFTDLAPELAAVQRRMQLLQRRTASSPTSSATPTSSRAGER